ncbi:MAG TPA: DUF3800 domain-containing protein [Pyrinomonadaceae bacterium]|jgi:hypothetical protein
MVMLSAYMDETGHSKDERQRFNGMAGLLAPAEKWIEFEDNWNRTLTSKEFHLPYFHMREFEGRHPDTGKPVGRFRGWTKEKRERLYSKLMRHIANAHALPYGAVIAMEDWRSLSEAQQKALHDDPYFLAYRSVIALSTSFLEFKRAPPNVQVAFMFSDQVEFKYRALQLYDEIYKTGMFIKRSAKRPAFEDMRNYAPLQAADIVAYEMYKEYDRIKYRPNDKPRWGHDRLEEMSNKHGSQLIGMFYSRAKLVQYADDWARAASIKRYWDKQRAKKTTKS